MGNVKANANANAAGGGGGGGIRSTAAEFSALPEGCIAHIISFTSPLDACRLSLVSSVFKSAADSDGVWRRFLPSEYADEVARAISEIVPPCGSKKELFFQLCHRPILIDDGAKSFSLDKRSGKKCFMLSPRDLFIVWGDSPRYWRWTSTTEASETNRFAELAELVSVCWLEIRGKIDTGMLSPATSYAAYLVFKPTTSNYGFQSQPVEVAVGLVGTESQKQTVYLDGEREWRQRHHIMPRSFGLLNLSRRRIIGTQEAYPRVISRGGGGRSDDNNDYRRPVPEERGDGWSEIKLGEFFHDGVAGELEMSVLEVKGGHWKSGLLIQGIEIRPKVLKTA